MANLKRDPKIWTTANQRAIPLTQMCDKHLENALKFFLNDANFGGHPILKQQGIMEDRAFRLMQLTGEFSRRLKNAAGKAS